MSTLHFRSPHLFFFSRSTDRAAARAVGGNSLEGCASSAALGDARLASLPSLSAALSLRQGGCLTSGLHGTTFFAGVSVHFLALRQVVISAHAQLSCSSCCHFAFCPSTISWSMSVNFSMSRNCFSFVHPTSYFQSLRPPPSSHPLRATFFICRFAQSSLSLFHTFVPLPVEEHDPDEQNPAFAKTASLYFTKKPWRYTHAAPAASPPRPHVRFRSESTVPFFTAIDSNCTCQDLFCTHLPA